MNVANSERKEYRKGLHFQRERFKAGKDGTGENNFDQMCDSIENLKSDLRSKIINRTDKGKETINRLQNIIDWYKTLELKHTRNTPTGQQVIFPRDIGFKINKNLTIAYELLVEEMDALELL